MNKNIFKNTGLQFIFLLIVLIFSVVFILFYVNYKIDKLIDNNNLQNKLNRYTIVSVDLKTNLKNFIKYKHSNIFYETYRDESTEKVFNSQILLYKLLSDIENNENVKTYKLDLYLKQSKLLLNDFSDNFSLLIRNIVDLGNENNGYLERLNYSEKRIVNILNDYNSYKKQFSEIQSFKINYLQSLSDKNADDFVLNTQLLIKRVILEHADNHLLIDALTDYLNNFKQIVKINRVIGKQNYIGLFFELDKNVNELFINTSLIIESTQKYITKDYRKFKIQTGFIIVISTLFILSILLLMYRVYIKGIFDIQQRFSKLVFIEDKQSIIKRVDFFNNIRYMILQINKDLSYKKSAINDFAEGNTSNNYKFNEKDDLGQSILYLQSKITDEINQSLKDKQKRLIEDKHKEGIAKFGKILRRHVGDIDTLTYELISELVHFLDAEIGGVYVVSKLEDKSILNLRASFAYNEKKMINKQIQFGEGLVGTCAVDKSTLFIDKVDDDYIKIVSGFGHTKPTSIIISPIIVDDIVYGVIELGATRLFNENDINFIEALAEDIAYTLSYLLSIEGKDGKK